MSLTLALVGSAHAEAPKPYALAQVWTTLYDQDAHPTADASGYGDPEDDVGFKIRRARIGFEDLEGETLTYGVLLGVSSGSDGWSSHDESVELVDAWAGYRVHELVGASLGVQKVPFGREALISSSQLVFQERSVASNHLGADREIGFLLDGGNDLVRVRLGAFNGNGALFGDTDPGMLYAARAEYTGGEGVYETYGVVDGLQLGVGANAFYNAELATSTLAYGGDIIVRVAGLAVLAEAAMSKVSPGDSTVAQPDVLVDTARLGGHVQVGYTVKHFEPAVRVELFDDDRSVTDYGDVKLVTAGVTAHMLDDRVRTGGGYVLRLEDADLAYANDTARLWFQLRY